MMEKEKTNYIRARIPQSFYSEIKDMAKKERRSVTGFVVYHLEELVYGEKAASMRKKNTESEALDSE